MSGLPPELDPGASAGGLGGAGDAGGASGFHGFQESASDDLSYARRRRRKRLRVTLLAAGLAGALVLSSCSILLGMLDKRPEQPEMPALPEVSGVDFASQQPNWVSCYDGMQCTMVVAPLDWSNPSGERIKLALVKQPALGGNPMGSLFVNPGGPGSSGVKYVASSIDSAVGKPLQQKFDVIGWDPRGVGFSNPVTCLDDAGMDEVLFGASATDGLEPGSEEWIGAAMQENTEFGEACLKATGPLLGHVDTGSTVKDLDMMRAIVGDDKLNYLGYSYGTYIGARYADAYPENVGKLVLDGAIDPTSSESEVVREQTRGFELALRAYMKDCLSRSECPVTGPVDEAMLQWRAMLDSVEAQPLTGSDGRLLNSGTLLTAIITPLYSKQSWSYLDQLYETVTSGDADTALSLADFYYDRVDGTYTTNLITAFGAINCLDYPRPLPLDLERMRTEAADLEVIAPTIGAFQGYGDVGCAAWPVAGVESRTAVSAAGADQILVIGTTGDPATPHRWAVSLAEQLQSGLLLTYEGEGHTAYGGSACVNAIVESYFLTGALPEDGVVCKA